MSIQLVSASLGNPLAATPANGAAASSGGDFGDLFNRIIGKTSGDEIAANGIAPMADALSSLALLPEDLRALLREIKAHSAEDSDRDDTLLSFLGSLNLPMSHDATMRALTPLEGQEEVPELAQRQGAELSLTGESKVMQTAKFAVTLAAQETAPTESFAEQLAKSGNATLAGTQTVPTENFAEQLAKSGNTAGNAAGNETLASAQAVMSAASTPRPAEAGGQPIAEQRIQTPVNSPAWAQDFGDKIVWMTKNGEQRVELHLTPAHLGPLQIRLHLDADKASANIVATVASPETRQAIEDALPRLKEMLASAGVELGETQVGTQAQQQQASGTENQGNGRDSSRQEDENAAILNRSAETSAITRRTHGDGWVDLFA
ncbi:MAG: flagellar hook-length control protein FliK [Zoogloeaceae bacterium]|jgi:flagellar hook-length control protein FliK|nr:flagellar hook-length control protein FliK [Zoogloeaceae bacterium]